MRKAFFTILLTTFCGLNILAQANVEREEYDVYAFVLKDIYKENIRTYSSAADFVILDRTIECDSSDMTRIKGLKKDLEQKNQTSFVLERKFPVKYTYFLINQDELDKFFAEGKIESNKILEETKKQGKVGIDMGGLIWQPFYQKYPEAVGYNSFSRVGFSPNRQFAALCVASEASFNGFSRIYILKKVKGKWKIHFSSQDVWAA
ncbi:MAG TPA: hypothetical protein VGC76_03710 [Pyrinomonadaceae bacterium]|jgi:hypothetical protein